MSQEKPHAGKLLKTTKVVGKGAWNVSKGTLKAASRVAQPVAKKSSELALKGAKSSANYLEKEMKTRALMRAQIKSDNWYIKAATSCENTVDSILNQKRGTSERVVKAMATKFGSAGATAGVFSIASLLGTASTGTAISSLSGAAFQSAALAWIGGSVATGGLVVLGVSAVGGIAAYFGARYGLSKFIGKKRKKAMLDEQERRVVETCSFLATSFRQNYNANRELDPTSAAALLDEIISPLTEELAICHQKVSSWPNRPKKRLENEIHKIEMLESFLKNISIERRHRTGMIGVPIATGVVSATFIKLLGDNSSAFDENEMLVLDALRRSNSNLTNATESQLADYVRNMNFEQLPGLTNSVKGIFHELSFQHAENNDGDEYIVELYDSTNHPGADVRIINTETNQVTEVQLKATNYAAYVREHNGRYEDISVFATSEVADSIPDILSSGFSNHDITRDTENVLRDLKNNQNSEIIDSMGIAAMIILARNAGAYLKGEKIADAQKRKIIEDGIVAASVAGLTSLIL